MTKNKEDEKRQSVVIETMRFPLIVLVLVVHVLPFDLKPVELDFSSMSIYVFVSEMISHNLGRIVVPCFFLFSGYFFFRKMNQWNIGYYGLQLKKRLNTLLIPYLLWNLLFMLAICSKYYLFNALWIDQKNELNIFREYSFFELLWLPLNFPLWYVRDLICMTILTPLFYILFKYTNIYGLLALLIIYLSTWDTGIQGLSIAAFFYFGFGAYMGIYKKSILSFTSRIALLSTVLSVILLLLVTYYNGDGRFYEHIVRLFIPFAIIATMNGMNKAIRNERFRNLMLKLAPTVFFVYAIHQIYVQSWIKGFFYKTSLTDTGEGMMAGYVLIPFFTLTVCLAIYYVWRKVSSSSLAFFTGGRNRTIEKRNI